MIGKHHERDAHDIAPRWRQIAFGLIPIAGTVCCPASAADGGEESVLGPIIIEATRTERDRADVPAAVSVVGRDKIQRGTEQLGLDEALSGVPGAFFQNRYNFAQDLRASIRGFGARSSFGIRGIRIIVDGIPETLPDGQGSVDGIDLGAAERITVLRGPASALYGNATGGAILIDTESGPALPFAELRSATGDYGYGKTQLKAGGEAAELNYLLNLSNTGVEGYRDHAEFENTQFSGRFETSLSADSTLLASLHYTDQPLAEDPGGLTAEEVAADRQAARAANVIFDAGEELEQARLGLRYTIEPRSGHEIEARFYTVERDFSNRLPFESGGAVELDRDFDGGGIKYRLDSNYAGRPDRLIVGVDFDLQRDDRQRFDNLQGQLGAETLAQDERVESLGIYLQNELAVTPRNRLTLGLRYDDLEFEVDDRFLADGDDSGRRRLDHVSPMAGLSFDWKEGIRLYANIATAFETPTTTEFANPDGGGFNPDLDAQQAISFELGLKYRGSGEEFEIAVFHIDVEDELIPYEDAAQPGRTFFENAGASERDGIEIAWARQLAGGLQLNAAWTWSDFVFTDFTDANGENFDGKRIPGIPRQVAHLGLDWVGLEGYRIGWEVDYVGEIQADNANRVEVDPYTVSNLRAGYETRLRDWQGEAFVGINNLFDEEYFGNIRINAFGGRYFEPAPERNAYIGFALRHRF